MSVHTALRDRIHAVVVLRPFTQALFGVLILLVTSAAPAAGLGQLTVLSSLGQPLHAEIDLVSVGKADIAGLSVNLASPDAYRDAGMRYDGAVAALVLRVEKRPNGAPYIKVTSTRPTNEFVVDLLVDLMWPSGRLVREYRASLDLPDAGSRPMRAEARPSRAVLSGTFGELGQ